MKMLKTGLISIFFVLFANAVAGSSEKPVRYPSFYCTWYSLDQWPTEEPLGFVVFGRRPSRIVPFPDVVLADGQSKPIWLAVQASNGRWSSEEAMLTTRFGSNRAFARLGAYPVTIDLPLHGLSPEAIDIGVAHYGEGSSGTQPDYICRISDLGLPGGAMSGGN